MRIRSTVRVGLGVMATSVVGIGVGANALAAKDNNNGSTSGIHDKRGQVSIPCDEGNPEKGTYVYDGSLVAWPPNHKMRTATITLTDEDGAPSGVNLMVTANPHQQLADDGTELNGSGHTPYATDSGAGNPAGPAAGATGDPSATVPVQFRGERSGRDKNGRTYTFTANGTIDSGLTICDAATFSAKVPHDMRDHPLD